MKSYDFYDLMMVMMSVFAALCCCR